MKFSIYLKRRVFIMGCSNHQMKISSIFILLYFTENKTEHFIHNLNEISCQDLLSVLDKKEKALCLIYIHTEIGFINCF